VSQGAAVRPSADLASMIVTSLILFEGPEHIFVVYDNFPMSLKFWLQTEISTVQFPHIILGVANALAAMSGSATLHQILCADHCAR
jgi:hypothetical protein